MPSLVKTDVSVQDAGLIDAYRDQFARAPELVAAVTVRTVTRVGDRILGPLRAGGSPITYPVRWQSDKQRAAFFATNGFGSGIPYRRSKELENGYKLTVTQSPKNLPSIGIANPVKYRKFVTGRYQQRMHAGRWIKEQDYFSKARITLADELETDLIKLLFVLDEVNL